MKWCGVRSSSCWKVFASLMRSWNDDWRQLAMLALANAAARRSCKGICSAFKAAWNV